MKIIGWLSIITSNGANGAQRIEGVVGVETDDGSDAIDVRVDIININGTLSLRPGKDDDKEITDTITTALPELWARAAMLIRRG